MDSCSPVRSRTGSAGMNRQKTADFRSASAGSAMTKDVAGSTGIWVRSFRRGVKSDTINMVAVVWNRPQSKVGQFGFIGNTKDGQNDCILRSSLPYVPYLLGNEGK